jgi:hypothetical protein
VHLWKGHKVKQLLTVDTRCATPKPASSLQDEALKSTIAELQEMEEQMSEGQSCNYSLSETNPWNLAKSAKGVTRIPVGFEHRPWAKREPGGNS